MPLRSKIFIIAGIALVLGAALIISQKSTTQKTESDHITVEDLPKGNFVAFKDLKPAPGDKLISTNNALPPTHPDFTFHDRVRTALLLLRTWNTADHQKAKKMLELNIKDRPDYGLTYMAAAQLAMITGYTGGNRNVATSYKPGRLETAQRMLDRSFALTPYVDRAFLLQAHLFLVGNDFASAEKALTPTTKFQDFESRALAMLAEAYQRNGQKDQALATLSILSKKADLSYFDYAALAGRYNDLNETRAAETYFKRSIETAPPDNKGHEWYNYGLFLKKHSRVDEAIAAYETALKFTHFSALTSALSKMYAQKGTILNQQAYEAQGANRIDLANRAVTWFRKSIEQNPKNSKAMYGLGVGLLYTAEKDQNPDRTSEALKWLKLYSERTPKDTQTQKRIRNLERSLNAHH